MAKKKTAATPPSTPDTTLPAPARKRAPAKKASTAVRASASDAPIVDASSLAVGGAAVIAQEAEAPPEVNFGVNTGIDAARIADPAIEYTPSYEEIAQAAYQRYLSRGGDHGRDFEDWIEAERSLRLK